MCCEYKIKDLCLKYENIDDILHVKISGHYSTGEEAIELLNYVAEKAKSTNTSRILFNFMNMTSSTSQIDLYDIGKYIASKLRFLEKFAAVSPANLSGDRKFVAMVAENRGLPGKVFLDLDSALEWLSK